MKKKPKVVIHDPENFAANLVEHKRVKLHRVSLRPNVGMFLEGRMTDQFDNTVIVSLVFDRGDRVETVELDQCTHTSYLSGNVSGAYSGILTGAAKEGALEALLFHSLTGPVRLERIATSFEVEIYVPFGEVLNAKVPIDALADFLELDES